MRGSRRSNTVPDAQQRRDDLATLNFAAAPAVLLELAEFRNPAERRQRCRTGGAAAVRPGDRDALVTLHGGGGPRRG
jgi:hypothetical protein